MWRIRYRRKDGIWFTISRILNHKLTEEVGFLQIDPDVDRIEMREDNHLKHGPSQPWIRRR
jgi:hypothetical protein